MFGKEGSGERTESLGIRRQVELPEANMDEAGDLAPTDSPPEQTEAAAKGGKTANAGETDEKTVEDAPVAAAPQGDGGDNHNATATDTALAAPGADGDGDDDEMPPDRPKKPVLAAVAIGGAVVLAVPILLIGTGSHHGHKKHPTTAAANTVLSGDGQSPAGVFTSASPSATPSLSPSATPSPSPSAAAKNKPQAKDTKDVTASGKKSGWSGVSNVLMKNAGSGLCADISGYGKGAATDSVMQYYCTPGDADNQVWSLGAMRDMKGPGGATLFLIRNTKDDLCMDLPYYSGEPAGSKVSEYYCRPHGDNQLWYWTHTHGQQYWIRNYASHGLCLGPMGRSHEHAKRLEVHKCGSGDAWSWPSGE
jgi:hypothetical protein